MACPARLRSTPGGTSPFVERVHAVIIRLAVQAGQLLVIQTGDTFKVRVGRLQESRTVIAAPDARVGHIQPQFLLRVVRYHARVTRQYGMDAVLAHPLQDTFLKLFLMGIPTFRIRSSPSFQVVHQPPCLKSRPGNEIADFLFGIAQIQQDIPPDHICPDHRQGQVDAVQGHPVDFLFPAVPVPESHAIGEGAIIEVIPVGKRGFVAFLAGYFRQDIRQIRPHVVPGQMDARIIFQVPVDAGSDTHVIVSSDHDLVTLLVQLEEVMLRFPKLNPEPGRGSRVYPFQQSRYRRSAQASDEQATTD